MNRRRRADCKCMHIIYIIITVLLLHSFSENPFSDWSILLLLINIAWHDCDSEKRKKKIICIIYRDVEFLRPQQHELVDQSDLMLGTVLNVITFHSEKHYVS